MEKNIEQLAQILKDLRTKLRNEKTITPNYNYDTKTMYQPKHSIAKSMVFDTENEAKLVHQIAIIAELNNMTHELQYLIPVIFRILKIDSEWSK